MEDKKERFLSIFNEVVHREGAEELLSWLSNSDFFTAPASTQYHGSHPGGLLEHSLNVYDCLVEEPNLSGFSAGMLMGHRATTMPAATRSRAK